MPTAAGEDENAAAMLIYQANMSNYLKQITELLKGDAKEQTDGVERMVKRFTEQLQVSLETDFKEFGNLMKDTGRAQQAYGDNCKSLIQAGTALVEVNRNVQKALEQTMKRQEEFSEELAEQKKKLEDTCENISSDISSQLYTFEQMRNVYEK